MYVVNACIDNKYTHTHTHMHAHKHTHTQLSGNNTRLRKNTSIARSLDSGRGSDAGMPPNLLAIQETEEADRELECAVDHRTNRDSNSVSIISSYSTAV